MPFIQLDNPDTDSRIDPFRDLPKSNPTRSAGHFIVEGRLLVERLLASDFETTSILVDAGRMNLLPAGIPSETPIYVAPAERIRGVTGFHFHRGLLACGRRRPLAASWQPPDDVAQQTIVACVDIQDPTNLGGILRNCAAFGVDAVLMTRRCADPFSRRVLRISMGTAFKLTLIEVDDVGTELARLQREQRFETWATVLDDRAEPLDRARRPDRVALLLGNEGHGLPPDVTSRCTRRITIPMQLGTDSLNAAVASGIFLYELTLVLRQQT